VNFNSHIDAVVTVAVRLVNTLTAGEAHGRPYTPPRGARLGEAVAAEPDAAYRAPPDGGDLPAAVTAALRAGRPDTRRVAAHEAAELSAAAHALRGVFEAVAAGDVDTAAELVNALLARTGAHPHLDRHDGEPWHLHFHGADDSLATGWAAGCATGLAVVLGSELYGRLGVCAAPHCDRVYVDTSRNGIRRFCSTSCQNRVKTAAFRGRRG
jgi:predicted RNA-binding Zn ribbon-like protein